MRRSVVLALLCIVALIATGCGAAKDTGFPPTPSPTETEQDGGDTSTRDEPAELTGPIDVRDNSFAPRYVTVAPGTTVTWRQSGGAPHNVVSVDDKFDSHPTCQDDLSTCMASGDEFSFPFEKKGEYAYYCVIHGRPTALDDPTNMAGTVYVK